MKWTPDTRTLELTERNVARRVTGWVAALGALDESGVTEQID